MSRIRTATRLPPSSFGRKMSQRLLQYTRPGSNSPTASTSPERLRPLPSPAIAILPPTCPHFHPLWWAAGPWDSPEKHVRTPAIFARHSPSSVFSSLLMGRRPMGHSLWSRLGWAGLKASAHPPRAALPLLHRCRSSKSRRRSGWQVEDLPHSSQRIVRSLAIGGNWLAGEQCGTGAGQSRYCD